LDPLAQAIQFAGILMQQAAGFFSQTDQLPFALRGVFPQTNDLLTDLLEIQGHDPPYQEIPFDLRTFV
jgi:hypothetical protein